MQHDTDTEPKGLVVHPNTLRAGAAKPRNLRIKPKRLDLEAVGNAFADAFNGTYHDRPCGTPQLEAEAAADAAAMKVADLGELVAPHAVRAAFREGLGMGSAPKARKRDCPYGRIDATLRMAWRKGFKVARRWQPAA